MNYKDFQAIKEGLYIIHWKTGGYSHAAIGIDRKGLTWMAPCNWVEPLLPDKTHYKKYIKKIAMVEVLTNEIGIEKAEG